MSEKKNTVLIAAAVGLTAVAIGAVVYKLTQPTPKPRPAAAAEAPKVEKKRKKKTETSTDETPSARPADAAAAKAAPAASAKSSAIVAAPSSAIAAAPSSAIAPAPSSAIVAAPSSAVVAAPAPAAAKSAPAASPKASPAPAPKASPAPAPAAPAAPVATRQQTFVIMLRGDIDGPNDDVRQPLTDQGRRTVRDNVAALASHGITRIETSPHLACLQSAEEAAKTLGLAPGCIRVNVGLANHSAPGPKPAYPTPEEVATLIPGGLVDVSHPWATEPARHPETTDDANRRFWETFITLDKQCLAENVLVITHELALYRIAQHVRGNPNEALFGATPGGYVISTREVRGAFAQPWSCATMSESISAINIE